MSMYMSIGSKDCCGMIEIYPKGEFTPIRGHGNMARKMGILYDRIDIDSKDSHSQGAKVPVDKLVAMLKRMLHNGKHTDNGPDFKGTCVLPSVIKDLYLERIKI